MGRFRLIDNDDNLIPIFEVLFFVINVILLISAFISKELVKIFIIVDIVLLIIFAIVYVFADVVILIKDKIKEIKKGVNRTHH